VKLRTRVKFSTTLNIMLNEKLRLLAAETRIPISKLIDEAVELLLKKHGQ